MATMTLENVSIETLEHQTEKEQLEDLEALLQQWEPKVHQMLRMVPCRSVQERQDYEQEMRIEISRAAKNYRHGEGASFHTFLHICMLNRIRQLMNKRKKEVSTITFLSRSDESDEPVDVLENVPDEPDRLQKDVEDFASFGFKAGEGIIMDLLLCGYKYAEIRRLSQTPTKTDSVFRALRKRMQK